MSSLMNLGWNQNKILEEIKIRFTALTHESSSSSSSYVARYLWASLGKLGNNSWDRITIAEIESPRQHLMKQFLCPLLFLSQLICLLIHQLLQICGIFLHNGHHIVENVGLPEIEMENRAVVFSDSEQMETQLKQFENKRYLMIDRWMDR